MNCKELIQKYPSRFMILDPNIKFRFGPNRMIFIPLSYQLKNNHIPPTIKNNYISSTIKSSKIIYR